MKNLILLLLFCPLISLSQVSNWRTTSPPPQTNTQSQKSYQSTQPTIPQRNDVSSWRSNPPKDNIPLARGNSRIIISDPYSNHSGLNNWGWGWNRWDMWGAPAYGWNNWSPMWYQNDWGYRQPARVYIYEDGKRDTVRGKRPVINFGIQLSSSNQVGGFFTIGRKVYFITELNSSFKRDNSTFFPFGDITQVDFPIVNDFVETNSFYIGFGKRIKRTGIHFMIGSMNEVVKWRGKDDLGFITFPKYSDRFTTIKVGGLHDYNNFTFKIDYDPIISVGTLGFGVNF